MTAVGLERMLALVTDLGERSTRAAAAQRLAEHVGARGLLIFVRDCSIGALLPASGFPQTIPGGSSWRTLLGRCTSPGLVHGEVAYPDASTTCPATALVLDEDTVLVLLGAQLSAEDMATITRCSRLLCALLGAEQREAVALAQAGLARASAQRAHALSLALDAARGDLQHAFERSDELNRELRLGARRKDEFLATLAHELRNPLSALTTALQVLRTTATTTTTEYPLGVAVRHAERLSRLLDDLLDVSRITQGKIDLKREVVDVGALMGRAAESVAAHAGARQLALRVEPPAVVTWVLGDPLRLEQILTNLLTNAIKYTDPGGHIVFGAAVDGGEVHLEVRDTGIGIEKSNLGTLFDVFVQAAADRSQGGLGIGLTLVRSLVELHGGRVSIDSPGLGQGTTVQVTLPTKVPPPVAATETVGAPAEGAPARRSCIPQRVLIVDDNADAADLLAELVRSWGHEARVAHDGATTLQQVEVWRPEAVLLDLGLPDMSGYEVASRLRQRPDTAHALLIALTGFGQQEDRKRTAAAGFDHHMVKPPDLSELEAVLGAMG